ncbi:uncharacterized protein LOC143621329 [Bidens hawaiensis]|uniref:uncharacterized protein LOC143621329 n=1 Tax=Bidens hawaiensis TaxID=980011 RepID=UPI00404A764C
MPNLAKTSRQLIKSPNEAFEVLEKAAKKSFAYNPPRSTPSHKGMHQVDSNTLVTAQLEALSKKFEQLQTKLVKAKTKCNTCGGEHKTKYCEQSMMVEDVDFVSRQNNTFGNTYNPGWGNHPNFSWKDGANNQTPPGFDKRPFNQTHSAQPKPQYHNQGPSTSQNPNIGDTVEILLTRLLANTKTSNKLTEERFHKNEAELRNQKASLQNIKNQANAITLRSGKNTQDVVFPSQPVDDETDTPDKVHDQQVPASTAQVREPVKPYVPPIPYPNRLKKEKMEAQYGKFLKLFKQLHINLPFIEDISQMPKYAKFLKDVLTNKRKLEELSHVTLNEECSVVLQNKLPTKKTDPGSFTIPCLIGDLFVSNALADLGASINLMPYAVFSKLGLGEPKPTRMSI